MKKLLVVSSLAVLNLIFVACASTQTPLAPAHPTIDASKAPREDIFDSPESVHWVPEARSWFVSSMGGSDILAKDNYGWITRLDEKGNVTSARWVQKGLHAPGGICHMGNELFVVDRDGLAIIDITKGQLITKVELPGVQFPNDDVCAKDGSVYVTDMSANKIYRWKKGMAKAEVWLESPDLDTPNGLEIVGNTMYVVTWGPIVDPATSQTSRLGFLKPIDMKTKKISAGTGIPVGNMDGITKAGNFLYGTDWMGGRLIRFELNGKPTIFAKGFSHIADIGYSEETKMLGIPEMSTNRVYFLEIK
ncbi:MAG: SMP-30/gluconolactonase/LRE family protein [Bdellovibrio sp.]|nr:SMP-30/gluconolactonase/LRE family protein [Bdellovibrio sp.]